MQRDRRRRCYEELKDEVSPSSVKICERKILTEGARLLPLRCEEF